MPQLRSSNRRVIVDDGRGHELPILPKTRKPIEDCVQHTRCKLDVADAQAALRFAGKAVSRGQTEITLRKYEFARKWVSETKQRLMEHLLTCETCSR